MLNDYIVFEAEKCRRASDRRLVHNLRRFECIAYPVTTATFPSRVNFLIV